MSTYRIGVEAAARPTGTQESLSRQGTKDSEGTFQAVFDKLTKWIPGDTLAIYVPGVTLLSATHPRPSAVFLVVMIVATPLFTIGSAFSTGNPLTRTVWVAAILATGAFTIWSFSVPISGWQRIGIIADNKGAVAIGAAIIGILFGYFAEGIIKRIQN